MLTMTALRWVCSEGGPLLAIPSELASRWRGVLAPVGAAVPPGWTWGDGGVVCDYDRACDMEGTVSVGEFHSMWTVCVHGGCALLLDGETSTAALRWGEGVVLLRDVPIETEAQANEILAAVEPAAWSVLPHDLELREGRLFVFDSASEGAPTAAQIDPKGNVLDIALTPGRCRVDYAAPEHISSRLALIRLTPVPQPT